MKREVDFLLRQIQKGFVEDGCVHTTLELTSYLAVLDDIVRKITELYGRINNWEISFTRRVGQRLTNQENPLNVEQEHASEIDDISAQVREISKRFLDFKRNAMDQRN